MRGRVGAGKIARWVIMGAAGRDFHNFHTLVRDHERGNRTRVIAFTATQIPGIEGRHYPKSLAGSQYPEGIPIFPEAKLTDIIGGEKATHVVFSYSDVPHSYVMERAALAQAAGAHFVLPGAEETMIASSKPVIAVCAVRTGCGKSQTSRMLVEHLIQENIRTVAIRHPMAYGDLEAKRVERFATYEDMLRQRCTIEEREEYEPYVERGMVVYAGVDYGEILKSAEQETEVVFWDGGNNDTPFYKPDLHVTIVDPLRPGHEVSYYPGLVNLTLADVVVVNKVNSARREDIETVIDNVRKFNPRAEIVHTESLVSVAEPGKVKGQRVLVVEDGPTVTHGEMTTGAGMIAARQYGASEIVDPTAHLIGGLRTTFQGYPHLVGSGILPAMGYGDQQIADLCATINKTPADIVLAGTPIDLGRLLGDRVNKPILRVRYESRQVLGPPLEVIARRAIEEAGKRKA